MPPEEKTITEAEEFIRSCHIITLGTSGSQSVWTAPVFYVYSDSQFYFFSKKSSRHIVDAERSGMAAASIHHNPEGWTDIKGIQMEGSLSEAGLAKNSRDAFTAYMKRFPFAQEIINKPFYGSLSSFQELFSVRWYTFVPEKMIYLDNSVRFGFKIQVK